MQYGAVGLIATRHVGLSIGLGAVLSPASISITVLAAQRKAKFVHNNTVEVSFS